MGRGWFSEDRGTAAIATIVPAMRPENTPAIAVTEKPDSPLGVIQGGDGVGERLLRRDSQIR